MRFADVFVSDLRKNCLQGMVLRRNGVKPKKGLQLSMSNIE